MATCAGALSLRSVEPVRQHGVEAPVAASGVDPGDGRRMATLAVEEIPVALKERVATWLELAAAAAHAQEEGPRLCAHAVGGDGRTCMVLSMNGCLLHDGTGRVTVFRNLDAVARFLSLIGGSEFSVGVPAAFEIACGDDAQCLCLQRKQCLVRCGLSRANTSPR